MSAAQDRDDTVEAYRPSAFHLYRAVVPGTQERGSGKIVDIASVQSVPARQTIAPHPATEGGVVMLTEGTAADLARHNTQVDAISPGHFATGRNQSLTEDEQFPAWAAERTPARRRGRVEELVGTLGHLCSDVSSCVSGRNVLVDGGTTSVP